MQPYIIPACAVDAPHRRDRVWFVAHRSHAGTEILQRERAISICESSISTDTPCNGWGGRGLNKDMQSNGTSFYRENRKGVRFGVNLSDVLASGLLPTVKAQDCRHALHDRAKSSLGEEIAETFGDGTSQNSQLKPLFVAEMMGFPTDWTLAPFLNGLKSINDGDSAAGGAENPSKPTATP